METPKKFFLICSCFQTFWKVLLVNPNDEKREKQDDLRINGPLFRRTVRNMASFGIREYLNFPTSSCLDLANHKSS